MSSNYNANKYLRHWEMTELLQSWSKDFPDHTELESLGKSPEGKDIWILTLTNTDTGHHSTKPAYWVSGNVHASELSGCQACLHVVKKVLDGIKNQSERYLELLSHNTLYVVPKVSPDGADYVLDGFYVRSTNALYPLRAEPTFRQKDMNGDGEIRSLLVPSRSGIWKKSKKDSRVLLRREPWENDKAEEYYQLYMEGRPDQDGDGKWGQVEHGYDYNRNFPSRWRPEGEQVGAGPLPLSTPETSAIAKAVLERPNIVGAQDFHTFSAVILRPSFFEKDEEMDHIDLRVLKTLGRKGEELTGYPCISVDKDFCYDHKNPTTGGFISWMTTNLGIYGYTNEIWSLFKQAGIEIDNSDHLRFIARDQTEEEMLKIFKWCDENAEDGFFMPWKKMDHPDFGEVEVGGWDLVSPVSNPPSHLLGEELEGNAEFVIHCAEANPRLEVKKKSCRVLDEASDTILIEVEVENIGYLGTRGFDSPGLDKSVQRPFARISLSDSQKLLQGDKFKLLPHLAGRCHSALLGSQFIESVVRSEEMMPQCQALQWVVKGSGTVNIEIHYPKGGQFHLKF